MGKDPGIGNKVVATVIGLKGTCNAGHAVGESLRSVVTIQCTASKVPLL